MLASVEYHGRAGKTSDVFGKCIDVCAVAISDSDPERRLLGWSLLQILPRLVLTPTDYGWHSGDSGRAPHAAAGSRRLCPSLRFASVACALVR